MFAVPKPQQNYLLAALPASSLDRLLPHLELVELPLGQVLYESGGALRQQRFDMQCSADTLQTEQ